MPFDGTGWVKVLNGTMWPSSMDGGCEGNVSATLTWQVDPMVVLIYGDDPPPSNVSGVESASVAVDMNDSPPTNLLEAWAMDGFGDEMVRTDGGGAVCAGSRSFCLPVPATGIVSLRPVRLWAIAHAVHRNDPCQIITDASYKIEFAQMAVYGFSTDGTGGDKPVRLSGTNCEVVGFATLPEGSSGIAEATLSVGGEIAAQYPSAVHPYVPGATYVSLDTMFDSTHFAHETLLPLTITVRESNGRGHSTTIMPRAYNMALSLAYGRVVLDFLWRSAVPQAESVATLARRANHNAMYSRNADEQEILDHLHEYTTFFACTHGDGEHIRDCVSELGSGEPGQIFTPDIRAAIARKAVHEYPAFNFAMMNTCNSAGDADMGSIDHSFQEAFGLGGEYTPLPDRGFVGWDTNFQAYLFNRWTPRFWAALANGDDMMVAAYRSDAGWGWPQLFGDPGTKIHGLYGSRGLEWRRQIL